MALSINLNTSTLVDSNHVVSISAGTNVTTTTASTSFFSKTNYALTPNSATQVTVATVTFTASTDYYYYNEPVYSIKSPYKLSYEITETTTKDIFNRVTAKVFVIKYKNTVNSLGDMISFEHKTKALPATKNTLNFNDLIEIKSFEIDSSDLKSFGGVRSFLVRGTASAYFNLKITRSNGNTYDFTTNTFTSTATELADQLIDSSGVYNGVISFDSVSADDIYTVVLSPNVSLGTTLNSNIQDSADKFKSTVVINQYKIITVTLTLASTSYSGSYDTLPSDIVFKAERNSIQNITTRVSWDLDLTANSFTFARGYGANEGAVSDIDFRSSIVKVKNGNQSAGTTVLLDDVDNLAVGMSFTGTGVTGAPRIVSINTAAKSIVASVSQNASGSSGMADNASITFTYGGSSISKLISGCEFNLANVSAATGYIYKAASLSPVKTAVNDTSVDGSDGVVVVDSADGIKAAATTFVSGLGIDAKTVAPHVDGVSSNTITLSANQTLEDNTPLVFTGSSRNANILFNITLTNIGNKDHTITFNLDTVLTVS